MEKKRFSPVQKPKPQPKPKPKPKYMTSTTVSTRLFHLGQSILSGLVLAAITSISTHAADAVKVEVKLDPSTAVEIKKEINGLPASTKVISTPTYPEYALTPVVDGIKKRKDLGWQDGSWASEEDENIHGIEVQLGKPQRGGRFQISWAYDIHNEDNGKWWVSRDYVIQIKAKADSPWKTVAAVKGNQSVVGSYALPDELIGFIRIYQLPGGGHADRPNIMWVGQIEVTE